MVTRYCPFRRVRRLLIEALAWVCVLEGGASFAAPKSAPRKGLHAAEAEARYQAGVDDYSHGRYSEALVAFQDALTLDPNDRAARAAVDRLRAERIRPEPAESAAAARRSPPLVAEFDELPLGRFRSLVEFERTLGDARNQQGEVLARQGRIAQLLAERRLSLARHRAFRKNAELHALSRRLATETA